VGKSRRHKHVDRSAHRNVGPGRTPAQSTSKAVDRRAKVAPTAPAATRAADAPSAIALPTDFEPLALGFTSPPGSRSRYPAKKTKRTRPGLSALVPTGTAVVTATAPVAVAAATATAVDSRVETGQPAPPVLLIAYQPQPSPRDIGLDVIIADDNAPALLEPAVWADDVFIAPVRQPVFDTPTPAVVRAAAKPLPRRAAVTPWRKSGPLDAIARWVRTNVWRLAVKIAPKIPRNVTEVARLRAENEALRRQLSALQQAPA
jgi:hypothetical protein